ncbi:MAG: class II aldolase/adducin family protein [Nitrososphaerota archaeon]|nr:class II aldolase/adducin family protein [Nitrososphaerota archaeon]MDG6938925.1 class II aldolase/adducin family protein [Nitrososphaerota archaeon]
MVDIQAVKRKLAMANRMIVNEGLTELGRGHMAYHLGEGKILIPAHLHDYGRTIADCTESDIVTIDFDGKVLEGGYDEPMNEFYFYTEVFSARKEVRAAAHMHPFHANLLAMSGKGLTMTSRDSFLFVDGVPIYSGLPLYVSSREMGGALVRELGKRRAILHRGHGAFVAGESIEETISTAASLERAAKKQLYASVMGTPLGYDGSEVRKTYSKELYDDLVATDWRYFVARLEKTGTIV